MYRDRTAVRDASRFRPPSWLQQHFLCGWKGYRGRSRRRSSRAGARTGRWSPMRVRQAQSRSPERVPARRYLRRTIRADRRQRTVRTGATAAAASARPSFSPAPDWGMKPVPDHLAIFRIAGSGLTTHRSESGNTVSIRSSVRIARKRFSSTRSSPASTPERRDFPSRNPFTGTTILSRSATQPRYKCQRLCGQGFSDDVICHDGIGDQNVEAGPAELRHPSRRRYRSRSRPRYRDNDRQCSRPTGRCRVPPSSWLRAL